MRFLPKVAYVLERFLPKVAYVLEIFRTLLQLQAVDGTLNDALAPQLSEHARERRPRHAKHAGHLLHVFDRLAGALQVNDNLLLQRVQRQGFRAVAQAVYSVRQQIDEIHHHALVALQEHVERLMVHKQQLAVGFANHVHEQVVVFAENEARGQNARSREEFHRQVLVAVVDVGHLREDRALEEQDHVCQFVARIGNVLPRFLVPKAIGRIRHELLQLLVAAVMEQRNLLYSVDD